MDNSAMLSRAPGVRPRWLTLNFIRSLKVAIVATTAWVAAHGALAQNIIVNGDFESNPPPATTCGDTIPWPITPWVLGSGNQANVVTVDQNVKCKYGNHGPQVDASAPGPGIPQHYLDIAYGSNDFYQSFTPRCSGTVNFGGFFSTRGNAKGTASITIREGVGTTGRIVGATQTLTLPVGLSQVDPWTKFASTVPVVANVTYSFIVTMNNEMNFDNGFAEYTLNCPDPNPCCPPWDVNSLVSQLTLTRSRNALSNIAYSFTNSKPYRDQMQAYIDYLHAVNPAVKNIILYWSIADAGPSGPGTIPSSNPVQIGPPEYTEWSCGFTSTNNTPCKGFSTYGGGGKLTNGNGSNVFNPAVHPLPPNRWYRIFTYIYLNDGIHFWKDEECGSVAVNLTVYTGHEVAQSSRFNEVTVEYRTPGATSGRIMILPLNSLPAQ